MNAVMNAVMKAAKRFWGFLWIARGPEGGHEIANSLKADFERRGKKAPRLFVRGPGVAYVDGEELLRSDAVKDLIAAAPEIMRKYGAKSHGKHGY